VTIEAEAGMIMVVVWYIMQPGSQFQLAQASMLYLSALSTSSP